MAYLCETCSERFACLPDSSVYPEKCELYKPRIQFHMITEMERQELIGLVEDEMQTDDWETAYTQTTRTILQGFYERLK